MPLSNACQMLKVYQTLLLWAADDASSAQAFFGPMFCSSIAGNTKQPCQLYPPHVILNLALDMDREFVLAGARFGGPFLGSNAAWEALVRPIPLENVRATSYAKSRHGYILLSPGHHNFAFASQQLFIHRAVPSQVFSHIR